MANAKRLMDAARTLHIEQSADAAVRLAPFVFSGRDRDRGASIVARAIEASTVSADLVAELTNAISRAVIAVVNDPKINRRLMGAVTNYLETAISSDNERSKAASGAPRLISLIVQQSIALGADGAINAALESGLLLRTPSQNALIDAKRRQRDAAIEEASLEGDAEVIGRASLELIAKHLRFRLRDPRNPSSGVLSKLSPSQAAMDDNNKRPPSEAEKTAIGSESQAIGQIDNHQPMTSIEKMFQLLGKQL